MPLWRGRTPAAWTRRRTGTLAALVLLLSGCATTLDNLPQNLPITPAFVATAAAERGIVGRHVVALSLSGGGLRAAAFAHGVLEGLAATPNGRGGDLFDDLTFISSVSGGSLTAAYAALNGRAGLARFRQQVLLHDFEGGLRTSLVSPTNLLRLLAGGVNDRSNLAATLDQQVFHGATFADLNRRNKPDVWINATDLYNRTPFPFVPPVFQGLCSDLSRLRVSEAVAASMAVPLVFAPVVLKTYPEACLTPLPPWVSHAQTDPASVAASLTAATARAVRNYRDPQRMRYVKLADGGLTDNQGLASILIARAVAGNDHGPFTERDAVRISRMLFLVVDAGRPSTGEWALRHDGPSALDLGLAAADAAIDSATRLSTAAFRQMLQDWRNSIVRLRCGLSAERVAQHLEGQPGAAEWRCDDVRFELEVIGFGSLSAERAERLRNMPTRLALPAADIDAAIAAGHEALRASTLLQRVVGPARD